MKKVILLAGILGLSGHVSSQSAQLAAAQTWLTDTFNVQTPFGQVLENLIKQAQQYSQNLSSVKNISEGQLALAQKKVEFLLVALYDFVIYNRSFGMRNTLFEPSSRVIQNNYIQKLLWQLYNNSWSTLNNISQYGNPKTTQAWLTDMFNVQTSLGQVVNNFTTIAQQYSNSLQSNKNLTTKEIAARQADITQMIDSLNTITFSVPPDSNTSVSYISTWLYSSYPSTLQGLWLYLSAVNNPELYPSPTPAYTWLTNMFNTQTSLGTVLTRLTKLAQGYSNSLDSNNNLNKQEITNLQTEITQLLTDFKQMVRRDPRQSNSPSAAFIKTNQDFCLELYNYSSSLFDNLYQYSKANSGTKN